MCKKTKKIIIAVGVFLTCTTAFFDITTGIYFGVLTNMFVNILCKEDSVKPKKVTAKKIVRAPYL